MLLERATPDLYRKNLFRVLNLSVTANSADARRHLKRLEMRRRLGVASNSGGANALALDPPPGEEEIRVALDQLSDPLARFLDEFWFWPLSADAPSDAALEALDRADLDAATRICVPTQSVAPGRNRSLNTIWQSCGICWRSTKRLASVVGRSPRLRQLTCRAVG